MKMHFDYNAEMNGIFVDVMRHYHELLFEIHLFEACVLHHNHMLPIFLKEFWHPESLCYSLFKSPLSILASSFKYW